VTASAVVALRHAFRWNRGLTPIFFALLVAACGTSPQKRGGYYQNDGPPERTPADLADAPDAVPRVEPLNPRANRPYTALGRSYTPLTGDVPLRQRGMASWYGKQFHGNRTASGEIFDMFAMTAAHPTMPIPSYARVVNPRNGRSVIVRVNDRGPFRDGRVIDLSYAAATKLGIVDAGIAEVEVERLTFAQIASGDWRRAGSRGESPADTVATAPAAVPPQVVSTTPPAPSGATRWSVQVGAFSRQDSAEALAARVAAVLGFAEGELPPQYREARVEFDEGVFRVLVGSLPERTAALALARELERLLGRQAMPLAR
jgi:rare lipoprotein A